MIEAGMNVARLNLSHGSHAAHQQVIDRIRSISESTGKPIAILADLQGPKIRIGKLKQGKSVLLKRNETVEITCKPIAGTEKLLSTTYAQLVQDVCEGACLFVDDGLMELVVVEKTGDTAVCRIVKGGVLKEHKGINMPGVNVSAPCLTDKDIKDLHFGIRAGVDFFALSFVRRVDDLKHIKAAIAREGSKIPVIAKIEKREAVEDLDNILDAADGIMIARGDLGVELRIEKVPAMQKLMIQKAVSANLLVITATQMLESMTANPVPTRAEVSDVANAIYDGTGAVMLSGETASGKYPVESVRMMAKIAAEAENSPFMQYNIRHERYPGELITHAAAQAAVNILHEVHAKAIVAFSASGKTAKLISKHRPSKPVYVFTSSKKVCNQMAVIWGITPVHLPEKADAKRLIELSEAILIRDNLVRETDTVVIVAGLAFTSGSTNLIKIHRVGAED